MNILYILIVLVVVGLVLWAINTYLPIDGKIKQIINIFLVVVVVIWLLQVAGAWDYLRNFSV